MNETVTAVTKSVMDSIRTEYNLPEQIDLDEEQYQHSSSNEEYSDYRQQKADEEYILDEEDQKPELKEIEKIMMIHDLNDQEIDQIENDEEVDDKDLEKSLFYSSSANEDFKDPTQIKTELLQLDKQYARKLSISQTLLIENSESDLDPNQSFTEQSKNEDSQMMSSLAQTTQYQTFESSSSTNSDLYKQDDFENTKINRREKKQDDDDDSNDDFDDFKPTIRRSIKKRVKPTKETITNEDKESDENKSLLLNKEISYSSGEVSSKSIEEFIKIDQTYLEKRNSTTVKETQQETLLLNVEKPRIVGSESREFLLQEDNEEDVSLDTSRTTVKLVEDEKPEEIIKKGFSSEASSGEDKLQLVDVVPIETVNLIYSTDDSSDSNLPTDLIPTIKQGFSELAISNEEINLDIRPESTDCSNCSLVGSEGNLGSQCEVNLLPTEDNTSVRSSIESVNQEDDDDLKPQTISKSLNYLASLVVSSNSNNNIVGESDKTSLEILSKQIEEIIEDKADLAIKVSKSLNFNQQANRPVSFKMRESEDDFITPYSLSDDEYKKARQTLDQLDQQTPTPVENLAGDFFDKRITSSNEQSMDYLVNLAHKTDEESSSSFENQSNKETDKEVAAAVATALLFSSTVHSQSNDEFVSNRSSDEDKLFDQLQPVNDATPRAFTKYIVVSKSTEKDLSSLDSSDDNNNIKTELAEGIDNPCFVDSNDENIAKLKTSSSVSSSNESMIINQDYDDTEDQLKIKNKINLDEPNQLIEEEEGVVINTQNNEPLIDEQTFLICTPTPSTQSPSNDKAVEFISDKQQLDIAAELVEHTLNKSIEIVTDEKNCDYLSLTPKNSPELKGKTEQVEFENVFEKALNFMCHEPTGEITKSESTELKEEAKLLINNVVEQSLVALNNMEQEREPISILVDSIENELVDTQVPTSDILVDSEILLNEFNEFSEINPSDLNSEAKDLIGNAVERALETLSAESIVLEESQLIVDNVLEKSFNSMTNKDQLIEKIIDNFIEEDNLSVEAKNVVDNIIEKALNTMQSEIENTEKDEKKPKKKNDDHFNEKNNFKKDDDDDDDQDDHFDRVMDHSFSNETVIHQSSVKSYNSETEPQNSNQNEQGNQNKEALIETVESIQAELVSIETIQPNKIIADSIDQAIDLKQTDSVEIIESKQSEQTIETFEDNSSVFQEQTTYFDTTQVEQFVQELNELTKPAEVIEKSDFTEKVETVEDNNSIAQEPLIDLDSTQEVSKNSELVSSFQTNLDQINSTLVEDDMINNNDDLSTIIVKPDEVNISTQLTDNTNKTNNRDSFCDTNPLLTSSFMSLSGSLPNENQDLISSFDLCDTLTVNNEDQAESDDDRLSTKTLNLDSVNKLTNSYIKSSSSSSESTSSYYTAVTNAMSDIKSELNKDFKSSASVSHTISSSNYMTAVDELSSGKMRKSNSQSMNISSSDSFHTVGDTSFQSDNQSIRSGSKRIKSSTNSADISTSSSSYSGCVNNSSSFENDSDNDLTPNLTIDSSGDQTDLDTDLTNFDDEVKLSDSKIGSFNVEYFLKNMYPLQNNEQTAHKSVKAKTNESSSHNSTLTDDENNELLDRKQETFTVILKEDLPTESKLISVDDDFVITDLVQVEDNKQEPEILKPNDLDLLKNPIKSESPTLASPIFEKTSTINVGSNAGSGSGSGDNVSYTSSVAEFEKLEMQCTIDSFDQEEQNNEDSVLVYNYNESNCKNYDLISHDLNTIYESPSSLEEESDLSTTKQEDTKIEKISSQNLNLNFFQIERTSFESDDLKSVLRRNSNDLNTEKSASNIIQFFKSSSSLSNSPLASPSSSFVKSMSRISQTPERETQSPPLLSKTTSRSSSSSSIKSTDSFENELKCKFKIDENSYFARKQTEKKLSLTKTVEEDSKQVESDTKLKTTKTNDSIESSVNAQTDSGQSSMNDILNSQYQLQSPENNFLNRQINDSFALSSQPSSLTTSYMSDLGGLSNSTLNPYSIAPSASIIFDYCKSDFDQKIEQSDSDSNIKQLKSRTSSSSSSSNSLNESKIVSVVSQTKTSTAFNAEDLPSFRKITSPVSFNSETVPVSSSKSTQLIPSSSSASNIQFNFNSNTNETKMKKSINSNPNISNTHSHHSSNCYCGKQTTSDYSISQSQLVDSNQKTQHQQNEIGIKF